MFRYNIFTVAFLIIIVCLSLNATTWRVNKNPDADADFLEIQDAHNAALNGDTILVEGYSDYGVYAQLTVTKTLYLFGPGHFLDENPETQYSAQYAAINLVVTFNSGSEGSVFSGFTLYDVDVYTSDITISRNVSRFNATEIDIAGNVSNVIIENNYIFSRDGALTVGTNSTGIIIRNNYLEDTSDPAIGMNSTASATIYNNVIDGDIVIYNSVINNNILIDGSFTGSNNTYNNNLSNSTQFGTDNGNQANIIMANVFVGASGNSTDGQWQLQPGSPAVAAGINGEDCGMFGGSTPYKLSCLPPIPTIFFIDATGPGTSTGGLNVHIKAKTHN